MTNPTTVLRTSVWIVLRRSAELQGVWVAHCLDFDVISQGSSFDLALQMVFEAIMMTAIDDLRRGVEPRERSAPPEYWDEMWAIVADPQAGRGALPDPGADLERVSLAVVTVEMELQVRRSDAPEPTTPKLKPQTLFSRRSNAPGTQLCQHA